MERDGIICLSNSPWSSPVHMVRTVPDSYPLPNMLDFSERIVECTNFSKMDVLSPDLDASRRYPKDGNSVAAWPLYIPFHDFRVAECREHLSAEDGSCAGRPGFRFCLFK
jgi:hypothetical protein